jgi:hypothetical protein
MFHRLTCLLVLFPGLAAADPIHSWGASYRPGGGPSQVSMSYCELDCFAQVRFENTFLRGDAWTRTFHLDLDGLAVAVTVVDGEGTAPDILTIETPAGYLAQPASLAVEEGLSGTIMLIPVPMS